MLALLAPLARALAVRRQAAAETLASSSPSSSPRSSSASGPRTGCCATPPQGAARRQAGRAGGARGGAAAAGAAAQGQAHERRQGAVPRDRPHEGRPDLVLRPGRRGDPPPPPRPSGQREALPERSRGQEVVGARPPDQRPADAARVREQGRDRAAPRARVRGHPNGRPSSCSTSTRGRRPASSSAARSRAPRGDVLRARARASRRRPAARGCRSTCRSTRTSPTSEPSRSPRRLPRRWRGPPDEVVSRMKEDAAQGQGVRRLGPERPQQVDGLRLLAARRGAADGVDAGRLGRAGRPPGSLSNGMTRSSASSATATSSRRS